MTTTVLRPDLQRVLDELDAVDRAIDALSARVSDEQFFWQPNGGRSWSIAQCIEHLALTNDLYGRAVANAIERARAEGLTGGAPIEATFFGDRFIRSLEPPVVRRFRAPRRVIPPTSKTRREVLQGIRQAHDSVRDAVRAAADVDVNRARFRNPFFPLLKVRVGTALRVIPAHDRRHVWQAENVTSAPGFPSAR